MDLWIVPRTLCCFEPHLEEPGEDVELKHRDVVVAGEVDGGLESHGLQAQADGVKLMECLTKRPPWHNGPTVHERLVQLQCLNIKHSAHDLKNKSILGANSAAGNN